MNRRTRSLASWAGTFLLLGAMACAAGCGTAATAPQRDQALHESWEMVTMGGAPVGYSHAVTRRVSDPQPQIVTTVFSQERMKRSGIVLTRRTREEFRETPEGALVYKSYTKAGMGAVKEFEVKVHGDKATVTTRAGGDVRVSEVAWDAEIVGPEAEARKIRESGFAVGKEVRFKTYDAESQRVNHESVTIEGRETVTIQGRPRELYKAREVTDESPGIASEAWLDETGEEIKSAEDVLGGVESVRVSRKEALQAAAGDNLVDLTERFAIPSNVKFASPKSVTEVLYRIEGPIEKLQLADRRQKIESQGPDWVLLRVKALGDAPEASAEKPDAECLKPSKFIQSDDEDIQRIARENTDPQAAPAANARRLSEWVFKNLQYTGLAPEFVSAKEALAAREGDCKEHAVLLAALLRAVKIPARTASGVTYFEGRFHYHMWTEAFLNDWTALDATLDTEVVDAAHIRMAVSALAGPSLMDADRGLAQSVGRIKIIVQEVK